MLTGSSCVKATRQPRLAAWCGTTWVTGLIQSFRSPDRGPGAPGQARVEGAVWVADADFGAVQPAARKTAWWRAVPGPLSKADPIARAPG
jgi:hypothetical protein